MVNKPDFSDPMQVPGLNPLVQQLLSKATVQAFTALANMSAADFSLLSKMVSGLLSKKNFEGISKFNHLVTFLPSLQRLYPEAVKRLKAEPFAHSSKNHFADASKVLSSEGRSPKQPILSESFKDRLPQPFQGFPQERFSESASFKEFFKEPSLSKEFAREQRLFELSKERSERGERVDQPDSGTPDLDKQAPLQKEKGAPSKSIPQELRLSENPITERGLPAMLATMKEVLSILAYFTNHIPALKLENPRVFQNVMESAMAQLVQPVATFSEGEFTSQNREVPGQQSPEKTFLKEKSLPLPSAVRQK
ncbi:MAG TPA: hypothetical protein VHL30_00805, partial [Chlamydiales bacterium]|nr:hypothetical protein [Chlamydiales bacterium]